MALYVFEASLDPKLRPETENLYGSGLSKCWNKFHELSLELRKYYKPLRSIRKDIVTTLDKIYGIDIPINLNIFETISDANSETREKKQDENDLSNTPNLSCEATLSCEAENEGNDTTVFDADWLFVLYLILIYRTAICDDYLSSHPASRDVFTATSLCDCIISMLESAGPDQNQEDLLNLLGIDSVETVFQILQHRKDLLQGPGESSEPPDPSSKAQPLSQRPIDNMGLDEDFLDQLKKQGLRLPNEPRGYDDRYKGYMLGVKLNHDTTMSERVSGSKTYHDVCFVLA